MKTHNVVRGSVSEVHTEMEVSRSIGITPDPRVSGTGGMIGRQGRLVQGLIRAVGNFTRRTNV
ncbi:MAG: hypothetical protein NFCOHLIN_01531 [Gammaproteobacteria bacterium]|nr:hypothetical protein [Gammaproteobacteria bacterium]